MIRTSTLFARAVSSVAIFALFNISVPYGAINTFGTPLKKNVEDRLKAERVHREDLAKRQAKSATRQLSDKEESVLQGRAGENPYLAGQNKWDLMYKGVNLMSGNYTTTATDMSFEGGYGIPVNVTRSYSANSMDEGPFGKGWTLSADVRSTAGGLLKSRGAPVRSVPVSFQERPSHQLDDPNAELANGSATKPAVAVIATDAGGQEETIQRDADGILTTPPWDKNTSDPVYEFVTLNGSTYQVLVSNNVTTPDGTVYTYQKFGTYPNGTQPWNSSATPEASNVLKVTKAVDRQGNETDYDYDTTRTVSFMTSNGLVTENPLISVQMPNGHCISFTWSDVSGAGTGVWRVTAVSDNNQVRTVVYTYSTNGLLTSVTTPGGKTTTYTYSSPMVPDGWTGPVASGILSAITDPRGLTTQIYTQMAEAYYGPNGVDVGSGVICTSVLTPNGQWSAFSNFSPGTSSCMIRDGSSSPWSGVWSNQHYDYAFTTSLWTYSGSVIREKAFYPYSGYSNVGPDIVDLFNPTNQDNIETTNYDFACGDWYGGSSGPWSVSRARLLGRTGQTTFMTRVDTMTSYNFMGNKLSETVREYNDYVQPGAQPQNPAVRTATTSYAYWGADKYYQHKAVQDQAGRYSYTDYYPSTATAGSRGQTYRIYDPKHAGFYLDTSVTPPSYATSADYWKYQLKPSDPSAYSSQLQYDAQGRSTDAWNLQNTNTSPWTYVQTHTTYGADSDGSWGQASSVVEDYGGINRTTQTLHYTPEGKADQVCDAAGHIFKTVYDLDGNIQNVTRIDGGLNQTIASYVYGTTNGVLTNGQVLSVLDGLSGVTENFTYQSTGGGLGNVSQVSESGGLNGAYAVSYSYTAEGDRSTTTYSTPNGITTWQYADYLFVGDPASSRKVFQTLRKLNSNGTPSDEEYHYAYDTSGRLLDAAFAQTPQQSSPTSGSGYYETQLASTRARAHYIYDPAGRTTSLTYYWDVLSGGSYASTAVLSDTCAYEIGTALNRGLKLSATLATQTQSVQSTYGYDPSLDYLTSSTYNDGLANANPTWAYDAAGNRTDAVCDNLNRPTSIQGAAVTSDVLGNRLSSGSLSYGWDVLNRMTSFSNASSTTNYAYRADGLRVFKSNGTASTSYRYDGQMGFEDVDINGSATTVTDYAAGARGIDAISVANASGTNVCYPLYDSHGNMVSTLARSGSGYSYSAPRTYDAWGNIRIGSQTGDPKGRYCASLGHKQDDESDLIYMRARYYEPTSGRFISEDPSYNGRNWYSYCDNNPVGYFDVSGKTKVDTDPQHRDLFNFYSSMAFILCAAGAILAMACQKALVIGALTMATVFMGLALGETDFNHGLNALLNVPGLVGIIAATAADEELLSKNAETMIISAILTVQLCADLAALSTIDG